MEEQNSETIFTLSTVSGYAIDLVLILCIMDIRHDSILEAMSSWQMRKFLTAGGSRPQEQPVVHRSLTNEVGKQVR